MHDATSFLASPPEGFPADYLLARIRSRLALLKAQPRQGPPPAVGTRGEYRWVYRQMSPGLRRQFAPYFLWFELRTILIALRHLRSGEKELVGPALAESMLSPDVMRLFTPAGAPFADASPLVGLLKARVGEARQLAAWYRDGNGREYEHGMVALYLEGVGRERLAPPLGLFFALLTDVKNLVSLAKQLRWSVPDPGAFIDGGTIPRQRLKEELSKEGKELHRLLRQTGLRGNPETAPEGIERALSRHLTGRIRREARERTGEGFVLAYLWECHLCAANAALLSRAGSIGADVVAAELIA